MHCVWLLQIRNPCPYTFFYLRFRFLKHFEHGFYGIMSLLLWNHLLRLL